LKHTPKPFQEGNDIKKHMRISYSALDTFTICPAKYKFQNIDKIKVPKSKEAIFGTIIHSTLKMMHEPSRLVPPTEEEVLEYFTKKWDPKIYDDPHEEATAFEEGIKILKEYYLENYPTKFNIVDLETFFEVPITETKTDKTSPSVDSIHLITGKIDRIDKLKEGFEVIDYKTSKRLPSQKEVDNNLQLSIYHLGVVNRWPSLGAPGAQPIKLSLYFLKHREKLSTIRTSEQLKETKENIIGIIKQIQEALKNENFEPRPNPLCAWCEYQKWCPMFSHKYKEKKTIDDKKITEIIKEYFEIKERSKRDSEKIAEFQEIINQYCNNNKIERVFSDIGYITRTSQERYKYNEEKLKKILKPLGKWEEVCQFNQTKLKKIIPELPEDIREKIKSVRSVEKEFKILTGKKSS